MTVKNIVGLNLKTQFQKLEQLRSLIHEGNKDAYIVNTVIEVIEDVTGVTDFVKASRSPKYSEKRYMLFYILYVLGFGYRPMMAVTGCHHTSVIAGIRKHKELYYTSRLYKDAFDKVVKSLPKL